MFSFVWKSGVFRSPGNTLNYDHKWSNEVYFKAGYQYVEIDEQGDRQYSITLNIKRSAKEMDFKVPYTVKGEFEFWGLSSITQKIFPFTCTITHAKCTFYSVVLMVPQFNNEMWPACDDAMITVRTRVLVSDEEKNQSFLSSMYKKGDFDMWICGADGKKIGLHRCVARTLWQGQPMTKSMTTPDKPFNLRVGNEPSLRYLIERMYQLQPSTIKLLCWKQVFLLIIVLQYESILEEVELKLIQSVKGHPKKMEAIGPLCEEFPSVKALQELKIEIVKEDMKAYITLMDLKDQKDMKSAH
jgi:hypothetical protein